MGVPHVAIFPPNTHTVPQYTYTRVVCPSHPRPSRHHQPPTHTHTPTGCTGTWGSRSARRCSPSSWPASSVFWSPPRYVGTHATTVCVCVCVMVCLCWVVMCGGVTQAHDGDQYAPTTNPTTQNQINPPNQSGGRPRDRRPLPHARGEFGRTLLHGAVRAPGRPRRCVVVGVVV